MKMWVPTLPTASSVRKPGLVWGWKIPEGGNSSYCTSQRGQRKKCCLGPQGTGRCCLHPKPCDVQGWVLDFSSSDASGEPLKVWAWKLHVQWWASSCTLDGHIWTQLALALVLRMQARHGVMWTSCVYARADKKNIPTSQACNVHSQNCVSVCLMSWSGPPQSKASGCAPAARHHSLVGQALPVACLGRVSAGCSLCCLPK